LATCEKAILKAVDLDPSLPEAHEAYAQYLAIVGRPRDSIREFEAATKLDPLDLQLASRAALNFVGAHEVDEAIRGAKSVLEV